MKPYPPWMAISRRLLLAGAIAATLVAAVVEEENWRGESAWRQFSRNCVTHGAPLEFDAYLPPPVPDDQNLFKTPVLARFLNENDPQTRAFNEYAKKNTFVWGLFTHGLGNWRKGEATDFVLACRQLRKTDIHSAPVDVQKAAEIVSTALDGMRPELDELCAAARLRPLAQLTLRADRSPIMNSFEVIRFFETALALRACARIELGQSDQAFGDLYAGLRLAEGPFAYPASIFVFAGGATAQMAIQPLWEGCAKNTWNEAQLAQLQALLVRFQPLAKSAPAFRADRAAAAAHFDTSIKRPFWMIRGWWQLNKIAYLGAVTDLELATFDPATGRLFLDGIARAGEFARTQQDSCSPFAWLIRKEAPHIGRIAVVIGSSEHTFILVRTVVALERYRFHHGDYPGTLAELVPAWMPAMPHDVIDGQPLRYQRTENGRYRLYSIGQNGVDDGGTPPNPTPGYNPWTSAKDGDWCWLWPAVLKS